jgi:hypothetical protein
MIGRTHDCKDIFSAHELVCQASDQLQLDAHSQNASGYTSD